MLSKDIDKLFRFVGWFFFFNALLFWFVGFAYLQAILSSDTLFKNSLVNFSSISGKIFVLLFSLVNYFSYMLLLAFVPAIVVWGSLLIVQSKRFIRVFSIMLGTLSLALLITDLKVYAIFKFHINMTILQMIFSAQLTEIFDFSSRELLEISLVFCLILLSQILLAWFIWKKVIYQSIICGKSILMFWFGAMLFSYFSLVCSISERNNLLVQQVSNLPLYNQYISALLPDQKAEEIVRRYSEEHFSQRRFSKSQLRYPLEPLQCEQAKKPYNLIFILVDSLRFDALDKEKMPNLTQFAVDNWTFEQHFSGGNATQPGLFSLFYSIPGSYWTAALEQEKRPVFFDILEKNNYQTRVLWSSEMKNPPFDKTIYLGLANIQPDAAPKKNTVSRDRYLTQEAKKFLRENKGKGPFFLNLFYDAPHGFCVAQFPKKYPINEEACSRLQWSKKLERQEHYNRYLNAVHFIDLQLDSLLNELKNDGYLDNSIIVISSDHGQEFNDNNHNEWGHTTNFTKYQTQIPLVIHWPKQPAKRFDYITTSYDLVPTLLQQVFACKNPIADYSIGQNLLIKEGRLPFVISGSYVNMGYVEADMITTLQSSGEIRITDKQGNYLANQKVRKESFHSVLQLMRKYYVDKRA